MLNFIIQIFGKNHYQTSRYHYLLGQVLLNSKQNEKAKIHFKKALHILKNEKINHSNLITFQQQNITAVQKQIEILQSY